MRRLVTGSHDQNWWVCSIFIITLVVFSIFWYTLSHDIHAVISNLFYIPVILACYRFPVPGFFYAIAIGCGYLGFESFLHQVMAINADMILQCLILILVGGVISYLSWYLKKREEGYRFLLSSIDSGVMVTNRSGIIQYANPYARTVLDRRNGMIEGNPIQDYAKDPGEINSFLASCEPSESGVVTHEMYLKRSDGYPVPIIFSGYSDSKDDIILTLTDLSEEKWMTHELATGKKVLKTFLDGISEGVFLSDTAGTVLEVNRSCREITGWDEGMTIDQGTGIFDTKMVTELSHAVSRSVYDKKPLTLHITSSDSVDTRHYAVILTPVTDESTVVSHVAGIIHDITEHEKVLNQVREQEGYLRMVLDGLPLATLVINPGHLVMSVNQTLSMLFEQEVHDLIGTDNHGMLLYPAKERPMLSDLLLGEDVDVLLDEWYSGQFSPSPTVPGAYEVIDFYPHIGESGKWIRSTAARLVDENGMTIGAVETFEDFTSQRKADETIRISEERFKIASSIATDLIFEYEQDTDRISWFGDIDKWLGLDSPGRVSTFTGWVSLIHHEDVSRIKTSFIQHVLTGDPINEELRIRHRNGQYQTWIIKAVALYNSSFQQVKTVGIVSDISEIRENEEAKKKALVAIEKYIEQFAILGDHIRNPLQVIAGYNDLQGGEYKEKISNQVTHVNRIVDELDRGWIESESIRDFLKRHYGINGVEKN